MIGAIAGDICGSRFERRSHKSKDFELFASSCRFTDDTVMSLAVAQALLDCGEAGFGGLGQAAVRRMRQLGRSYPDAGYDGRFTRWLLAKQPHPYGSFGNGSAMRVSACSWAACSLEEALQLAEQASAVTHNHPEGVKGAQAAAAALYLARTGAGKDEIRAYLQRNFYLLDFTLDEIREAYRFDSSCQGSVPQALEAFLEAESFEDVLRLAVSIGGDSDTIAAIAGSVAEAYFGVPDNIRKQAESYLSGELLEILRRFEAVYPPEKKCGADGED